MVLVQREEEEPHEEARRIRISLHISHVVHDHLAVDQAETWEEQNTYQSWMLPCPFSAHKALRTAEEPLEQGHEAWESYCTEVFPPYLLHYACDILKYCEGANKENTDTSVPNQRFACQERNSLNDGRHEITQSRENQIVSSCNVQKDGYNDNPLELSHSNETHAAGIHDMGMLLFPLGHEKCHM